MGGSSDIGYQLSQDESISRTEEIEENNKYQTGDDIKDDIATEWMNNGTNLHNTLMEAANTCRTSEEKNELAKIAINFTNDLKAKYRKTNNNCLTFYGENVDNQRSSKRHKPFWEIRGKKK